jgi:hypothetical protein
MTVGEMMDGTPVFVSRETSELACCSSTWALSANQGARPWDEDSCSAGIRDLQDETGVDAGSMPQAHPEGGELADEVRGAI